MYVAAGVEANLNVRSEWVVCFREDLQIGEKLFTLRNSTDPRRQSSAEKVPTNMF